MTKNAKAILEIVNHSDEHLTAEQIYLRLREAAGKVVLATVYNNLNALCEQKLIHKVVMENAPDRYDRIVRHDHLICSKCGKITDLYLDDMKEKLEKCIGVQVDAYDLKLFYVCEDCRQDMAKERD